MPVGPAQFRPLQSGDTGDPRRLEDYLRELERQVVSLSAQLNEANTAKGTGLTTEDLLTIKEELEAGGSAALDLSNLPGVIASSVDARIPRLATAPDPVTTPYDTYVLTGSPDTLWQINRDVNPPVPVQLAFVPANMLTTDTPQIVTAAGVKTIQAAWIFQVSQAITAALAGSLGLTVTNSSADATAQSFLTLVSDGGSAILSARSAANSGTLFGLTLADAAVLVATSLANGLFLGTATSAPIRFGTNNTLYGTLDATGLWTLSVAGKTLLIKPPSAPAANTLMFEVQTNAAVSVFSVDIEGDTILHALNATADSTITGGSTALTVNGTNAASGVVVFDVKHSGTTVFDVTGDGAGHFLNNLDVDVNLNVDGTAQIDGATTITGMTILNGGVAFAPLSVSGNVTLGNADVVASVNTNAARSISMPPTPTSGQTHWIKDAVGTGATTNNISVLGNGSNFDNGTATHTINVTRAGFQYTYDGSLWLIMASF